MILTVESTCNPTRAADSPTEDTEPPTLSPPQPRPALHGIKRAGSPFPTLATDFPTKNAEPHLLSPPLTLPEAAIPNEQINK